MLRLIDLLGKDPDFPKARLLFMLSVSGLAGGAMLVAINQAAAAIAAGRSDPQAFLAALVLLILVVYTQHQSLVKITEAVEDALLKLRLRIGDRLRHAQLRFVETTSMPAVQAVLAKDTQLISQAALALTLLARSSLVVAVSLTYLGWISLSALLAMLAFAALYGFFYGGLIHPGLIRKLRHGQTLEKRLPERLRAMFSGFKEIKLSRRRNDALFEQCGRGEGEFCALRRSIGVRVADGFTIGYATFYLSLIMLVIVIPGMSPELSGQVFKITATAFFILSEINPWLTWIPEIARADASLEALCRLEADLEAAPRDETVPLPPEPLRDFTVLCLGAVEFYYPDERGGIRSPLGPIDLSIKSGELLFVAGRNGSGKTALLKLIAGLYRPGAGTIRVDDRVIDPPAYPVYRELFCAVFADFFLFERLYGQTEIDPVRVSRWLETMGLSGKVGCVSGGFRPLDLSSGEMRRLAWVCALLEDKPIVLFDDFATDQDPEFREKLYREILPGLKREGKTVMAVVRDERYFDVADRVLRMEGGRLV